MTFSSRFFLQLAYNGTRYHGWQVQPNAPTVQETMQKALAIVLREPIETTGCGRTDTGVHARDFFAHFDAGEHAAAILLAEKTRESALSGMNALLPADIAIKRILPMHPGAHARFDAVSRSYAYHTHFRKDPFKTDTSWLLGKPPDMEAMNEAAALLKDFEDFSSFSKSHTQVFTNNCSIQHAEWQSVDDGLVFHISANRFLRNMVRAIVGTLVDIGHGKMPPQALCDVIESRNRSTAGASVPACGLHLTEIIYPYLHPPKQAASNV